MDGRQIDRVDPEELLEQKFWNIFEGVVMICPNCEVEMESEDSRRHRETHYQCPECGYAESR